MLRAAGVKSACGTFVWTGRAPPAEVLPARQVIFDVIGDLFTHGRQLKHLDFNGRIIGLLGKLAILGCFVP